jgi:two-component system, LytTR family, response regulator
MGRMGNKKQSESGDTLIKTLIVDDEPLAREGIRRLLRDDPSIRIIGECGDGVEAIRIIKAEKPDLVFLDVQMPEVDGFGVIDALRAGTIPSIIFVTAHDRYAIEAFRVHALDYLLKPVDPARFSEAVERVKSNVVKDENRTLMKKLLAVADHIGGRHPRDTGRIAVKESGRIALVNVREIDWIEASGDYVSIHTPGERHLLRETMTSIEGQLDPGTFVRIHRSAIVNLDRVKELRPLFRGEYALYLFDGTRLIVSRTYRKRLEQMLHRSL